MSKSMIKENATFASFHSDPIYEFCLEQALGKLSGDFTEDTRLQAHVVSEQANRAFSLLEENEKNSEMALEVIKEGISDFYNQMCKSEKDPSIKPNISESISKFTSEAFGVKYIGYATGLEPVASKSSPKRQQTSRH